MANVFLAGYDIESSSSFQLDYILAEARDILLGYDGHRGYDWLVPSGAEALPVFEEEGIVREVRPVHGYYLVEIQYSHDPAIQIADLAIVHVHVGDRVTRKTVLGLARLVDTHASLDPIYEEYGVQGMIHVSFRERPDGGDKVPIPPEYGDPAGFPCQ